MVVLWLFFFLALLLAREKNDVIMRNGDRITYGTSPGIPRNLGITRLLRVMIVRFDNSASAFFLLLLARFENP